MPSASTQSTIQGLIPRFGAPMGQYKGWIAENKFAENTALSGTLEDIWNVGGIEALLSSAETMDIVSTDGNDKGTPTALTGARTLTIYGLDSSYNRQNETITLDGTNPVTTSNSYLRVFRMVVRTAGSTGSNEGTITCTASSSASVHGQINIGDNQTLKSQYTVPDGYYALISDFELGTLRNDEAQISAYVRPFGEVFQIKRTINVFATDIQLIFEPAFLVPPKADMTVRGLNTGPGDISVTSSYDFYLIPAAQVNV